MKEMNRADLVRANHLANRCQSQRASPLRDQIRLCDAQHHIKSVFGEYQ